MGLTAADAAQKSALFPLFGGISVLLAGFLSDRLGKSGRAAIIFYGMLLSTAVLLLLAFARFGGSKSAPVVLVALVAFVMIGPYSYLAGAISLDFGGKQGSATASGLIDGAGYLGGVLAGNSVGRRIGDVGLERRFCRLISGSFVIEPGRCRLSSPPKEFLP